MILRKDLLLVLLIIISFRLSAQTEPLSKKDSTIVSSWIFGLGFNAVDDSDDRSGKLFDIKNAWNAVPFPSRISIGKYFRNGLGVEAIGSYNYSKEGKTVEGLSLSSDKNYYSIDSRLSYDLNKIIGETGWFDPYFGVGIGYTYTNSLGRFTYNGIVGFRTWFSDRLGLDVNSTGKWSLNSNVTIQNHIQHAVGVVYRFKYEKDLTKKGREKLELLELEQKELVRINDSIALANKILNQKRLQEEELNSKKEKDSLDELEKVKQQTFNRRKEAIENDIKTLQNIYFNFDSSSIKNDSSDILSRLVSILNKYPDLVIEITSHTDSRGSKAYNQTLSERRLKSTIEYILSKGISKDRIQGRAYGEDRLVNECDDYTKCSEKKHLENRRSEINIADFIRQE